MGGLFSFHILGIHGAARNATVIYVDLTPRGQPDVGGKLRILWADIISYRTYVSMIIVATSHIRIFLIL